MYSDTCTCIRYQLNEDQTNIMSDEVIKCLVLDGKLAAQKIKINSNVTRELRLSVW